MPDRQKPFAGDIEPAAVDAKAPPGVAGRIYLEDGRAGAGLTVRLYGRGFGGAEQLLGETTSDAEGFYGIPHEQVDRALGIELRVVGADEKEVQLSGAKYEARAHEVLNLVAPAALAPLTPEFHRLAADVEEQLEDLTRLGEARESAEQQDLTVLCQATGWDARALGLAAQANSLEQATGVPQEALYGLFRAGLPTDPAKLALVSGGTVEAALGKAQEAGVIGLEEAGLLAARRAFERFAETLRRQAVAPGTLSPLGELLDGLSIPAEEREVFEEAFFAFQHEEEGDLWQYAEGEGVSPESIERLRLQGKLAFLTLNNAPLERALREKIDSPDELDQLVELDLHTPQAWRSLIRESGGDRALEEAIPSAYGAEQADERLDEYSADMARKVRLSFPTRVMARLIETGELELADDGGELGAQVSGFLKRASRLGFELGQAPVQAFVTANAEALFGQAPAEQVEKTVDAVKTVQRLHQLTPSDDAMKVLLEHGFRSARDVRKIGRTAFVERYGELFRPHEAELVSRRAEQLDAVVYSFYGALKEIDKAPGVPALGASPAAIEQAKKTLLKHYPTMEGLFGSLDFCECEHCRSVLSPAAYLVDLLQLLDRDASDWRSFAADWKRKHGGEDYAAKYAKPFEALVKRRPDLPNLRLDCENTNVELPYIDLVNEILEASIAEGKPVAHDTGSAQTAELLGEPQHTNTGAYEKLREARYPLELPFDLWLESVRAFLAQFQVPLWEALAIFRRSDALFAPADDGKAPGYQWAEVFAEQLELSPAERKLLTAGDLDRSWHELYGFAADAEGEALKALGSAKALCRRLGVSPKQLIELISGGFVNPQLDALAVLRTLELEAADVFRFKRHASYPAFSAAESRAFEAKLAALEARFPGSDARAWLDETWAKGEFDQVVVLADPDAGSDFDKTLLRYADGRPADASLLLRLNLLVRLWRKLGWSIAEADRALQVFVPGKPQSLAPAKLGKAMRTALVYLAHLSTLAGRLELGGDGREKLLTLWSDLPTAGERSLYARLFLAPQALEADAVFDDALGQYLAGKEAWVADHLPALEGALGLSATEIDRILASSGKSAATTKLSLGLVSHLYRHRVLCEGLKLTVAELIALKEMSGLDPFLPLAPGPLAKVAEDHPFEQTLRFVEIAETVRESGFSAAELEWLLRHRDDPAAPHGAALAAQLPLLEGLAADIARIRSEHAIPEDPLAFDDVALAQKLALLYPPKAVEAYLEAWTGAVRAFEQPVGDEEPQLTAALAERLTGFLPGLKSAAVLAPLDESLDGATQQSRQGEKRKLLAAQLLPYLQRTLIDRLVAERLAGELGSEPSLLTALAGDTRLLEDPSTPGAAPIEAFAELDRRGVAVSWFESADASGAPLASAAASTVEVVDPPAGARSARFEGYLVVPYAGEYRISALLGGAGEEVELRFDHQTEPLLAVAGDGAPAEAVAQLAAGVPYGFSVVVRHLGKRGARLFAAGARVPKGGLGQLTLYPRRTLERASRAQVLLGKAVRLSAGLGLGERELRHLSSHAADFGDFDLGMLPTLAEEGSVAQAQVRFGGFLRAAQYVGLKRDLGLSGDELVDVFERARRSHPSGAAEQEAVAGTMEELCGRFASLARCEASAVAAAARELGIGAAARVSDGVLRSEAPGFASELGLRRIWKALRLAERLGVPADVVASWTAIVTAGADGRAIAEEVRNAARARVAREDWPRLAQPVFDRLRARQRTALVAYLMHRDGFERLERLYEHFLVDPGMEPVVRTSRIQLAIASVQLFVTRCLMNLEEEVHPSAIVAGHWEWMKRYRAWEANRKIFLFPENWLEPEFRDDKSNLFRELESSLLQEELTDERAEEALFEYLRGLEQIARLEIVSSYVEEKPADPAASVLHVIGRTQSSPRRYFYRRYAHQSWTPWEPIETEIEGSHVAAAIWRGRLHVFWVTFLEQAVNQQPPNTTVEGVAGHSATAEPPKRIQAQLHWVERFQGKWTTREAGAFGQPVVLPQGDPFVPWNAMIYISKEYADGEEGALRVNLSGQLGQSFRIVSKNSPPVCLAEVAPAPPNPYNAKQPGATRFGGRGELWIAYRKKIRTAEDGSSEATHTEERIISRSEFELLLPSKALELAPGEDESAPIAPLVTPFFFSDDLNTFYVEPRLVEKTLEGWEEWAYPVVPPPPPPEDDDDGGGVVIVPMLPKVELVAPFKPLPIPGWGDPIDPIARFKLRPEVDWLALPGTILEFDGALLGSQGKVGLELVTLPASAGAIQPDAGIALGGGLSVGEVVVVPEGTVADGAHVDLGSGLSLSSAGRVVVTSPGESVGVTTDHAVTVVGGGGLSHSLLRAVTSSTSTSSPSFGALASHLGSFQI